MSDSAATTAGSESQLERLGALFNEMFTKIGIESDEYMTVNMQPSSSFSFEVICRNPKVREITMDESLIETALSAAQNIDFSSAERSVRPKVRADQYCIILRDIVPETPTEDILEIFQDAGPSSDGACPKPMSARSDLNNTWFVSFGSDADARLALSCIRNSKFNGSSVKARLKTESLNKAYFGADRYGPGTPGTMGSQGMPPGDFYSPGGSMNPMMMMAPQHSMYYGYPGPGAFMSPLPGPYPGMSPMGGAPGMWPQQGPGGFQNNRQGGKGGMGGGNMQNRNNNRNQQQQRISPRGGVQQGGRGGGYPQQQGQYFGELGQAPVMMIPTGGEGTLEDPSGVGSVQAAYGGADGADSARMGNNQQQSNRRSDAQAGKRTAGGDGKKKTTGNTVGQNNNQAPNKKKDGKPGEQQQVGKGPNQNRGAQLKTNATVPSDNRKKDVKGKAPEGSLKGPNFNLNAADFPAAWEDTGKSIAEQGGQKGSWTAALLGGNKAASSKGGDAGPALGGKVKKASMSDKGAAAQAAYSNEEHHSILVTSFGGEKRERHNSFGSEAHISFVADASDEPSHLHRVPTPIPSEEEVLERWQGDGVTSPPPLHVNDTVEERHSQRIVPGTHVAKEMETLLFGSFPAPVADTATVEDNTSANVHVSASTKATDAATPAPAPGGKRSFIDVLKASKK